MKTTMKQFALLIVAAFALGGIAMSETLITAEALLGYAGLTPDEIPYTLEDVQEVIEAEQLTEEMISGMPEILVEESLEQIIRQTGKYDYSYLLKSSEPAVELTKSSVLRRVAVFHYGETTCETLLVDLENGRYYYDGGKFMLDFVVRAVAQDALNDEARQAVESVILNSALPETATCEHAGSQWGLCVETADGIMNYGGTKLDETDTATVSDAMLGLLNLFRNL